jgi:hypothetical protein
MAKDIPPKITLKGINQKLADVEKKVCLDHIYTDKPLQKLKRAVMEYGSVEQLIDSTPSRRTIVISDDCGSPFKFHGRCVLGLVWIAPWVHNFIRRASYEVVKKFVPSALSHPMVRAYHSE